MKKLFSILVSFMFLVVVLFNNTMTSFATGENMQEHAQEGNMMMDCCDDTTTNTSSDCTHDCCYKHTPQTFDIILNSPQINEKQKLKLVYCLDVLDISLSSFENKNLVKKTSPPLLKREIKNYSYTSLTKIIKSNT